MKYVFLSILVFMALKTLVVGQTNIVVSESPQITAKVEKIVIQHKVDWVVFEVNLRFKLLNNLNQKLFLQKGEFNLYGVEVFRKIDGQSRPELVLQYNHPPSYSGKVKWITVGQEMIDAGSKSIHLISLNPNESFYFEKSFTFGFQTEKGTKYNRDFSWNEIKEEKELFLQFDVNIWEPEIRTDRISSKDFPMRFSERVKKQGVIWFDNITSELVPLDLSSAVVKTRSSP